MQDMRVVKTLTLRPSPSAGSPIGRAFSDAFPEILQGRVARDAYVELMRELSQIWERHMLPLLQKRKGMGFFDRLGSGISGSFDQAVDAALKSCAAQIRALIKKNSAALSCNRTITWGLKFSPDGPIGPLENIPIPSILIEVQPLGILSESPSLAPAPSPTPSAHNQQAQHPSAYPQQPMGHPLSQFPSSLPSPYAPVASAPMLPSPTPSPPLPSTTSNATSTTSSSAASTTSATDTRFCYISDVEIGGQLGSGVAGEVFKAVWQMTTPIALKRLVLDNAAQSGEFHNEAKILQSLRHPGIVMFLGIYRGSTDRYLATEWMPLGSLLTLLQHEGQRLSFIDRLQMAKDACAGVCGLHNEHIVHRDLACRNLLVKREDDRYKVKVGDLGLSKLVDADGKYTPPRGSQVQIAFKWAAPEIFLHREFSFATDIWALAVSYYELFCNGREPYYGEEYPEVRHALLHRQVLGEPDMSTPDLYRTLKDCWAFDPRVRPTALQLFHRIRSLLEDAQSGAVPVPPPPASPIHPPASPIHPYNSLTVPNLYQSLTVMADSVPGPQNSSGYVEPASSEPSAPAEYFCPQSFAAADDHTAQPFALAHYPSPQPSAPFEPVSSSLSAGPSSLNRYPAPFTSFDPAATPPLRTSGYVYGTNNSVPTGGYVDANAAMPTTGYPPPSSQSVNTVPYGHVGYVYPRSLTDAYASVSTVAAGKPTILSSGYIEPGPLVKSTALSSHSDIANADDDWFAI